MEILHTQECLAMEYTDAYLMVGQLASMDSVKEVVTVSSEGKIISVTFGKPMYCRVELVK